MPRPHEEALIAQALLVIACGLVAGALAHFFAWWVAVLVPLPLWAVGNVSWWWRQRGW
jgi:hypothetical protein